MDPDEIRVRPDPKATNRVWQLQERSLKITQVTNATEAQLATRMAGEIREMEEEITFAKKQTKGPIRAIENGIEAVAKELLMPVLEEKRRIGKLLAEWVQKIEAELALERQKAQEALRTAEEARRKAEEEAERAKNEAERLQAEMRVIAATMKSDLQADLAAKAEEEKPKIAGGQIKRPHKFRLINPKEVFANGFMHVLRIELDILACQDEVRAQQARSILPPHIPGVEITQETVVHVRASRR